MTQPKILLGLLLQYPSSKVPWLTEQEAEPGSSFHSSPLFWQEEVVHSA